MVSRTFSSSRYVDFPSSLPLLGRELTHDFSATSTTLSPTISSLPLASSSPLSRLPGGSTTSPPPSVSSRVRIHRPIQKNT